LEKKAVSGIMLTLLLMVMMATQFVRGEMYWYDVVFVEPEEVEVYVGEQLVICVGFGRGFDPPHPIIIEFSLGWDPSMLEFVEWESLWGSPTVVVGDDNMTVTVGNPGINTLLIEVVFEAKTVGSTILNLFNSNVYTVDGRVEIIRRHPRTVIVDDDGPADFHSIQEAINKSSRGDTIYVKAGTYYEHVVVSKTLAFIGENKEVTIIDGNETGTVVMVTASHVNITGFTIRNSGSGYRYSGVFLSNSANSNISGNIITSNTGSGAFGMLLQYSDSNVISGNILSYNRMGIELQYYSNDNFIYGNTIVNNSGGIVLYLSGGSKLRNNTINNNSHNFGVYGPYFSTYLNDIDTSNTVNGKPVYYLINQKNLIINPSTFPDIGYLGIINSTNVRVENLNMTKNLQGVLFAYTHNSTMKNVNSSKNNWGIYLTDSNDTSINENIITNNGMGIALFDSSANAIKDNVVTENSLWGIWSIRSSDNSLSENTIASNYGGVFLSYSNHNKIYHNNLINNTNQATLYDSTNNVWHDDYPSGGNYWSNYNGTDSYRGPNQDKDGSDGIGDVPYVIDMDNQDNYPLMNPWTSTSPIIAATIDIDPDTLNLKNEGQRVTCYIELPESYNVSDIDVSSILLNDTIPVDDGVPTEIGDYDSDGIPDLMVQFNRTELTAQIYHVSGIIYGNVTLTITGQLTDETPFESSDNIKVLFGGDADFSGYVEMADFFIWRENFGKHSGEWPSEVNPDFDSNGFVELADFYIWRENFGATVPPPP
jgi:parallel beta-helix repeat protein